MKFADPAASTASTALDTRFAPGSAKSCAVCGFTEQPACGSPECVAFLSYECYSAAGWCEGAAYGLSEFEAVCCSTDYARGSDTGAPAGSDPGILFKNFIKYSPTQIGHSYSLGVADVVPALSAAPIQANLREVGASPAGSNEALRSAAAAPLNLAHRRATDACSMEACRRAVVLNLGYSCHLWHFDKKNSDTLPLFLRDTFDAKMLRKWHPGKSNAKYEYTCQALSPVYCVFYVLYSVLYIHRKRTRRKTYISSWLD